MMGCSPGARRLARLSSESTTELEPQPHPLSYSSPGCMTSWSISSTRRRAREALDTGLAGRVDDEEWNRKRTKNATTRGVIAVATTAEMCPGRHHHRHDRDAHQRLGVVERERLARSAASRRTALSRMSSKTKRSCSRKLPTIVTSVAMMAAMM